MKAMKLFASIGLICLISIYSCDKETFQEKTDDPVKEDIDPSLITPEVSEFIVSLDCQSCGQSREPANPDVAVHIPGTPTGYDANSVMLACFGANEDGEFGFYDRVALEYLY